MLKDLLYLKCETLENLLDSLEQPLQDLINKISSNIIYSNIENVNENLLDILAIQFSIDGYDLAITIEEKRNIIKKAILLHKHKGTPFSIKESIKALGYYDCNIIQDKQPILYDGQYNYDNNFTYSETTRWALFDVIIDIGESKELTHSTINKLIDLINQYKNERSHLNLLSFKSTLFDNFDNFIDVLYSIITIVYDDLLPWGIRYNGTINYNQGREKLFDGSFYYNSQYDFSQFISDGFTYNNKQDEYFINSNLEYSDICQILPRYDGNFYYQNFFYGNNNFSAIDTYMDLTINKSFKYNGTYNYFGLKENETVFYNSSILYDGEYNYKEPITHIGYIQTMEYV